jgi:hypothetical protein
LEVRVPVRALELQLVGGENLVDPESPHLDVPRYNRLHPTFH